MHDDQAALLQFENADTRSVRIIRRPHNVHLLSAAAWLRGPQQIGITPWPTAHPTRRPRNFSDLPNRVDEPAEIAVRHLRQPVADGADEDTARERSRGGGRRSSG